MHALVIYESTFGNTMQIAQSIGSALQRAQHDVEIREVSEVDAIPAGIDLLVVGGPTQGHGVDPSMKSFLDLLPEAGLANVRAAAFDTRLRWPKFLSGAASRGIAERLERKGARIVAEPESFLVADKDGPLIAGETERAASWAGYLMQEFSHTT